VKKLLYELPKLKHVNAGTVNEAAFWLNKYGNEARPIAGGTDLLSLMKDKIQTPQVLVNIKTIPEMTQITYNDGELQIGAAVTLSNIIASDTISKEFNILKQAARQIGTIQIQNRGTVGGNLCQRSRCIYFRHPDFNCHRKGGPMCYAITGEHRYYHSIMKYQACIGTNPSDMAPPLIALKAQANVTSLKGQRRIPLRQFFTVPNNSAETETILKPDEVLTRIDIPKPKPGTHQLFLKSRKRHSSDFSLASVAIVCQLSNSICQDINIILGGVAPTPYAATEAQETITGKELNKENITKTTEASLKGAHPLTSNSYKINLTKALIKRALTLISQENTQA
jgi:xanthine dehydrogenase YagS FAD-binding subunit